MKEEENIRICSTLFKEFLNILWICFWSIYIKVRINDNINIAITILKVFMLTFLSIFWYEFVEKTVESISCSNQ